MERGRHFLYQFVPGAPIDKYGKNLKMDGYYGYLALEDRIRQCEEDIERMTGQRAQCEAALAQVGHELHQIGMRMVELDMRVTVSSNFLVRPLLGRELAQLEVEARRRTLVKYRLVWFKVVVYCWFILVFFAIE